MLKYIIRRTLYMIPTVFGVILITFVLFNIAGGDPAMLKLGKNANPRSLEAYDVARGYDKPLLAGLWGSTRAYAEPDLTKAAGPWAKVEGALITNAPEACLLLPAGRTYTVPLAFELSAETAYRWQITYRLRSAPAATMRIGTSNAPVQEVVLASSTEWSSVNVPFRTGATGPVLTSFEVTAGGLEVREIRIQKKARHLLDSQLFHYFGQLLSFDFGVSAETNQKISQMVLDGVLPSLSLTVPIFFLGLLIEVAVALLCAFFRDRFIDRFFVILSVALMSVPYLVWIVFGQYFLGYEYRLFPVWGYESMRYLVLPIIIGTFSGLGAGIRLYRTVMLDEVYRDYVRTALAKGVSRTSVLLKHVLKNAMIPILTSVVMAIPFLYTGNLLLESFFGIPGLGNLAINGINNSDFDVIRAVVFVGAIIYVVANLVTDICYTLVDPRVRLG